MSDNKFISGLIVKAPHERAPEYVKAKISIKRLELIEWLQQQEGEWINADVKVSRDGKWYASVDDWKPNGGDSRSGGTPARQTARQTPRNQPARGSDATPDDDFDGDTIPFGHNRGIW